METIIFVSQLVVGVLLIGAVLIQNRGTGVGAAFGGSGGVFHTKRGVEKTLHYITIGLTVAFLAISFLPFVL